MNELNPPKKTLSRCAGYDTYQACGAGDGGAGASHATSPSAAVRWAARSQCGRVYKTILHYQKRSFLSINILGCRPKRHVKQRTSGASHA
jgi:hypothetical protein